MITTIRDTGLDVVTGAFSYSGRAIAARLLEGGREVRTLTGHPERASGRAEQRVESRAEQSEDATMSTERASGRAEQRVESRAEQSEDATMSTERAGDAMSATRIQVRPFDFGDMPALVRDLEGATTLYNTYWVRFARGDTSHDQAVANSRTLFHAARHAGVQRIVHISITHPTMESRSPYFHGKALVERTLAETGVPYSILRPAILFGADGVLVNNIAWLLRHFPVFAIGGRGEYRIRPIHVGDLADLCLAAANQTDDTIIDAVGPERPTFVELVREVRAAVGSHARIVHVPGVLVPPISSVLNFALRDVLLTSDEYRAMAAGLADTDGPATAPTALSHWLVGHASTLGTHYANELQRHFR